MMPADAAAQRQGDCWRCTERVGLSPFCQACAAPQPIGGDVDCFALLGLPRRLDVDLGDLERRYHEASRRVHPDRHQTASVRVYDLSIAASAALNRAYRTLRDPVARGRYWLELHGDPIHTANNQVPADLAELVFDVQEQLADARAGRADHAAVEASRASLGQRLRTATEALATHYERDGAASDARTLAELKRLLSDIAYLRTLLRDVEAALAA